MAYDPNQPRDKIGRWTEVENAARSAAGLANSASEQELLKYLKRIDSISPKGSAEGIVLKHGKGYKSQPLPEGIQQGTVKECFENATKLAAEYPNYTYVEGFAFPDFINLPIHHAWVVDEAGNVIDNTWKKPGSAYFGIPISLQVLLHTISEKGTYTMLMHDNEWFRNLVRNK